MKLTVYYSVSNGGDGSAYPIFFVDKEIAEYHQETEEEESWAEDCTGWITFEGDNLSCPEAQTKEGYYLELLLEGWENEDQVQNFVSKFFPKGLPEFNVNILDDTYYGILLKGRVVHKVFSHPRPPTKKGRLTLKTSIAKGEKVEV